MRVAIHQPLFLPWLGYLDRMARGDLFIVLDHVQFARRNYQNRTQILLDGQPHWLTVPVQQRSQQECIVDKRIDNLEAGRGWGARLCQTLAHAYRRAPFLDAYLPDFKEVLELPWERLADLDLALLQIIRAALDIRTPLVRSSALGVEGTRSELILNLCRAVGADTYLAGMGGSRHYLDREAFAAAGIAIDWQDFRPTPYAQCGEAGFIPGLSSVDLLFNHGPASRAILRGESVVGQEGRPSFQVEEGTLHEFV